MRGWAPSGRDVYGYLHGRLHAPSWQTACPLMVACCGSSRSERTCKGCIGLQGLQWPWAVRNWCVCQSAPPLLRRSLWLAGSPHYTTQATTEDAQQMLQSCTTNAAVMLTSRSLPSFLHCPTLATTTEDAAAVHRSALCPSWPILAIPGMACLCSHAGTVLSRRCLRERKSQGQ